MKTPNQISSISSKCTPKRSLSAGFPGGNSGDHSLENTHLASESCVWETYDQDFFEAKEAQLMSEQKDILVWTAHTSINQQLNSPSFAHSFIF